MRAIRSIRTLFLALLVSSCPPRRLRASSFPSPSLRPYCRCMRSRFALGMAICGPLVTGLMAMRATTGCREPGCLAPRPGFLWTPGYWGWGGGFYAWHGGYWGPHVGFYGGVNYGFGYGGVGFFGGRWEGGHFAYNTAVLHVNTTIVHNTYIDNTVIRNTTVINRTSFNGPNGINARPNGQEMAAMREQHVQPTSEQMSHEHFASTNRANFASVNGGRPANAAVSRPMTQRERCSHRDEQQQQPSGLQRERQSQPAYNNNNAYKAPANNERITRLRLTTRSRSPGWGANNRTITPAAAAESTSAANL